MHSIKQPHENIKPEGIWPKKFVEIHRSSYRARRTRWTVGGGLGPFGCVYTRWLHRQKLMNPSCFPHFCYDFSGNKTMFFILSGKAQRHRGLYEKQYIYVLSSSKKGAFCCKPL
ncbi:MAG: hypothetical protein LBU32_16640 [Clostridiales bacterium]|jgi:hypothetical protein|nr:hypothetical protein [Clostridiales bacterium]